MIQPKLNYDKSIEVYRESFDFSTTPYRYRTVALPLPSPLQSPFPLPSPLGSPHILFIFRNDDGNGDGTIQSGNAEKSKLSL